MKIAVGNLVRVNIKKMAPSIRKDYEKKCLENIGVVDAIFKDEAGKLLASITWGSGHFGRHWHVDSLSIATDAYRALRKDGVKI